MDQAMNIGLRDFSQASVLTAIVATMILLAFVPAFAQHPQNDSPCNQGRAQYPEGEPRSSEAICMPEIGRMPGVISTCSFGSEDFGMRITPVGDVNNDSLADWCVAHVRCDTLITVGDFHKQAEEVLLYHGVRGGLPDASSGQRIGPTEIASVTSVLAAGDWDADGHQDIAVSIKILGDTSYGNVNANYELASLVIFWGNAQGHYSLADTTRIPCSADSWMGFCPGLSADFDGDGIQDLLIWSCGGAGFNRGQKIVEIPRLYIYRGHRNGRWGRQGVVAKPDWTRWYLPPCSVITLIDQDCDGARDIVFTSGDRAGYATIGVLYGRPGGGLPDTNDLEIINLSNPNGHYALLTDLTGDGVPEIAATCGNQEVVKIWAGRHGMRLTEQFGSGLDEPPSPGWVARPWVKLWMPLKINPDWNSSGLDPVFNLGDANADGIPDLWVYNAPWILCYTSGLWLDSLIDAIVDLRPGPIYTATAILGDIDGSGRTAMAIGNYQNVIYIRQSPDVPHWADQARFAPPGTDTPCAQTSAAVNRRETLPEIKQLPRLMIW
jgi:hypothetical protein